MITTFVVRSVIVVLRLPQKVEPSALPQTLLTVSGVLRLKVTEIGTPSAMLDSEVTLAKMSVNGVVK